MYPTGEVASEVAAAQDSEMGRCILALYRSAAQPAMRELGERLCGTEQRPGLVIIASEDPFTGTPDMGAEVASSLGAKTLMLESRIIAVDHVNLEALPQAEEELRWFYGELAALDEIATAAVGGSRIVFKSLRIELRIQLRADPDIDPIACRVAVRIPSLEGAVEALNERKIEFQTISGLRWTDRRITLLDPGGNRVALLQEWPMFLI